MGDGPSCNERIDALNADPREGKLLSKPFFASNFLSCWLSYESPEGNLYWSCTRKLGPLSRDLGAVR